MFLPNLLKRLIEEGIIGYGITIPYMLGAYKIKEQDRTPITEDYIVKIFQELIAQNQYKFWISTCDTLENIVIHCIDEKKENDILDTSNYEHICNHNGIPIVFFEEYFSVQKPTVESVSQYFWDLYKDKCFVPQKYSYDKGKRSWTDMPDDVIQIINNL